MKNHRMTKILKTLKQCESGIQQIQQDNTNLLTLVEDFCAEGEEQKKDAESNVCLDQKTTNPLEKIEKKKDGSFN
jgi:nucleoid-associated protein YejK